jgi:hypothetical protein
VGLVVHAGEALDHGLLDLLNPVGSLAALRIDLEDGVVVNLGLEPLRPAAVAAKPCALLAREAVVHVHSA